jgi:hypothetical protein
VAFGLLAAVLVPAASADDGRTPIYQPTTIDEPGSYYLTRDIDSSTDAIKVQASPVVLDLNGYEVSGGSGWASIRIELDGAEFTVRDGFLRGARHGLYYFSSSSLSAHIRVENVTITNVENFGIRAHTDGGGSSLIVADTVVEGADTRDGISLQGGGNSSVAVTGTKVLEVGLTAIDVQAEEVRIEDCTIAGWARDGNYDGLNVTGVPSGATLANTAIIRNNNFSRHNSGTARAIQTGSEVQATIADNDIALPDGAKETDGIYCRGYGSVIEGNRIAGADEAIYVSGKNQLIQNNHVSGSQNGIWFGTGTGHVYRDNMLRDNDNPTNGAVPSNGDQGGNIL